MMKLFISLILMMVNFSAFANAPTLKYFLTPSVVFDSKAAVCPYYGMVMVQGEGGNIDNSYCVNSGSPWWAGSMISSGNFCEGGALPDTTKPLSEQCPAPPPPACPAAGSAGEINITSPYTPGNYDTPKPTTDGNCGFTVSSMTGCVATPSDGLISCGWKGTYSGAAVSGPAASSPVPAGTGQPVPSGPLPGLPGGGCIPGTVQIGTDPSGTPICMGSGTNPGVPPLPPTTTKPSVVTTAADGTVNKVDATVQTNADGSKTTTTITTSTSPGGEITVSGTTVTGKTASGVDGVRTDKPEETANDFCKLHPELTACRNSSVSGSCGQIACTGDAIQCATLRAVAAADCRANDDKSALLASSSYVGGNGILSGADPQQGAITSLMAGTSIDLSSSNLDQSGFLGGGSCFGDKTFMVSGHVVTVSFTTVCNNITPLRYIILACSLMAAYMLVSKSILQG